ncbi:MAG TPA: translation initiation factor IF-2 subunit beta [Candidatus Paceibacterota bacterium]|nr:translation initiation factor IF-2 subunit beta [Candidatus Paceibacterota bacterium]
MESYEKMLDEAYEKVKLVKTESKFERFEIPKANSQVIGNKTVISNFLQITSYLRRDPMHLAKFLSKELAAFSKIENERLVLNRKIQTNQINEKIAIYSNEFVTCKECKKPDTELIKQDNFMFIHCLACGAKHSVRAKI